MAISPYLGLLAIDAEKFSQNADVWLGDFAVEMEQLISAAMKECGFAYLWDERLFTDRAGDGYFFGFDSTHTGEMISPLLDTLQDSLFRRNAKSTRYSPLMRLRVALHVGPVHNDNDEMRDGSGATRDRKSVV